MRLVDRFGDAPGRNISRQRQNGPLSAIKWIQISLNSAGSR